MQNLTRCQALDILRGTAMLWMTAFHFCFDLANAGYIQQNFYADPFWTWQRTCILSLFLFCAGFSQALVMQQGQTWRRFWRRWWQIVACAALVTAGSMLMFPHSFIYYGVLHGMAVMLIVARLTAHWGKWLWVFGLVAMLLPWGASSAIEQGWVGEVFNAAPLNVLGLISTKPITEDYVPLFPWLGMMWWGLAAGQCLLKRPNGFFHFQPLLPVLRPVAFLGRWSLSYYMLHQPVLLGGLWLWASVS
jgi:uncharacterized membrane protein